MGRGGTDSRSPTLAAMDFLLTPSRRFTLCRSSSFQTARVAGGQVLAGDAADGYVAAPRSRAGRVRRAHRAQAHQRAADYTLAKGRLGLISTAFGAAVMLSWTLLGGLDALNAGVRELVPASWGEHGYQLALGRVL